jgi:hypothetical protein
VLHTLIFILCAYAMYALISALSGRKGSRLRARSPWRRYGWLALVASTGIGLVLAVVLANSFDRKNQSLKLSRVLGTVWAEGFPDKLERLVEDPSIKTTPTRDQPAYALLHPGTSPSELSQEKRAPKPRPALKTKVQKAPAPQARVAETAAPKPPKEQGAAKNESKTAKKKKTTTPANETAPLGKRFQSVLRVAAAEGGVHRGER